MNEQTNAQINNPVEGTLKKDLQVDRIGTYLQDKKIALCVTGGIAAIEAPKIARHLRRYGSAVKIYATKEAFKFVGESALEWGSDNSVISELSGRAEHICLEDLVLVAPATMNTVNKIFSGIADNVVTALVASALGMKKPVYLAPTMHDSLHNNPVFQKNISLAGEYGLNMIEPRHEEGKRKMPNTDVLVSQVVRALSEDNLRGKKILITGGPTPGKIDDIRRITNIFTGKLAVAMAKDAYLRGADVNLLLGKTGVLVPSYIPHLFHADYAEYCSNVMSALETGYDAGIFSAAVADYIPEHVFEGKIPSGGSLQSIHLVPTRKVIEDVRWQFPGLFMVTFKYEGRQTSHEELLATAKRRVSEDGYQLVVANRSQDMEGGRHSAYIVGPEGVIASPASKQEIAGTLLDEIGKLMG